MRNPFARPTPDPDLLRDEEEAEARAAAADARLADLEVRLIRTSKVAMRHREENGFMRTLREAM